MSAIDDIDAAFGTVARPKHFCSLLTEEGEDHDTLLQQRDRETLTREDMGDLCWTPIYFMSPEGMAYYMPVFARFALSDRMYRLEWFGDLLISCLRSGGWRNTFLRSFDPAQRAAICNLLIAVKSFSQTMEDKFTDPATMQEAIDLWRE